MSNELNKVKMEAITLTWSKIGINSVLAELANKWTEFRSNRRMKGGKIH